MTQSTREKIQKVYVCEPCEAVQIEEPVCTKCNETLVPTGWFEVVARSGGKEKQ